MIIALLFVAFLCRASNTYSDKAKFANRGGKYLGLFGNRFKVGFLSCPAVLGEVVLSSSVLNRWVIKSEGIRTKREFEEKFGFKESISFRFANVGEEIGSTNDRGGVPIHNINFFKCGVRVLFPKLLVDFLNFVNLVPI